MKTEHTELPLRYFADPNQEQYPILQPDGKCVGHVFKKEDAEFIVRACNSHYESLAALEKVKALLSSDLVKVSGDLIGQLAYGEMVVQVDAALAKVKGEK